LKNVTIVGGGTAGYVTALILKTRFRSFDINVIKSDKIGIIGVGEGTTEHWSIFMDYVGIDWKELIKETDATGKGGVLFNGWKEEPYMHSIGGLVNLRNHDELICYVDLMANDAPNHHLIMPPIVENKFPKSTDESRYNQYHFNTHKLNTFLEKKCKEADINIIIDEITEVETDDDGITKLIGSKLKSYTADFYIDSTGFRRVLISKLGAEWVSNSKYLKMKEAIAFPTPDTDDYANYTLAQAMKYGWMWRIPTYGRWGNGYIFDSDYIDADQAKKEVEEFLGHEIEVGKHIKFTPGKLKETWIKNCLATGLSANFIEPLEATSIGTTIRQAFLLLNYLENYSKYDIIDYNHKINKVMDNVLEFVALHYITDRDDTEFWKSLKDIDIPPTLSEKLRKWETRIPFVEDFVDTSYHLFGDSNFTQVLYGLKLVNKEMIKQKYNNLTDEQKEHLKQSIELYWDEMAELTSEYYTHKEWLTKVRSEND